MRLVLLLIGGVVLLQNQLSEACTTSGSSSSSSSSRNSAGTTNTTSEGGSTSSNQTGCGRPTGPMGDGNKIAPWIVQVNNGSGTCFGIIIDANWVMTQASCVNGLSASSILVVAGVNDTFDQSGSSGGRRPPFGGMNNFTQWSNSSSMPGGPGGMPGGPGGMPGTNSSGMPGGMPGGSNSSNSQQRPPPPNGFGSVGGNNIRWGNRRVVVGYSSDHSSDTCPVARVILGASNVVINSNYNQATGAYNVALIQVNASFSFDSRDIKKLCLPQSTAACSKLCVTNSTNSTNGQPSQQRPPRKQGSAQQFNGCGFGSNPTNQWSQISTDFEATIATCTGSATASNIFGATPVTTTGGSGGETVCLLPNDPRGTTFTVVCCIMDWISQTINPTIA